MQAAARHWFTCYNYNWNREFCRGSNRLGVNRDSGPRSIRRCGENATSPEWYCDGCKGADLWIFPTHS